MDKFRVQWHVTADVIIDCWPEAVPSRDRAVEYCLAHLRRIIGVTGEDLANVTCWVFHYPAGSRDYDGWWGRGSQQERWVWHEPRR